MSEKILIVDDEPSLLFSLQEYLTGLGYQVLTAEDGATALNLLTRTQPDLIISDIMMEGMDGFEFQKRVASLTGNAIPFIFLTARADLDDRLMGLRSGADDYITKPFEPEELVARITAVLQRIRRTRLQDQKQLEKMRGQILAEVSKRLQRPVQSLVQQLNFVIQNRAGRDLNAQKRLLRTALQDARVLENLVDDLAWAALGTSSETQLHRETVRVAPVIRRAAASAARLAGNRGVGLKISCGGLLTGILDTEAVSRAVSGLLEAVVRLAPPGALVTIRATRAQDNGLELVVTDAGSLAATPDAPELSNALDFARRIAEAHGGHLSTRQEEGRQSYIIWLPGRVVKQATPRG